jgi:hypothetical protein
MLRTETVTAATLELLTKLMGDDHLNKFFLVGGTALSLQIGHRMSIDIDLFSTEAFDENEMLDYLSTEKDFRLSYKSKNTLKGKINDVQVDLITHSYPLVRQVAIVDGVRLASLDDIAAMKLNAIVGNGTRAKDFLDIAYLSCHLSFGQMIQACSTKYKGINPFVIVRSLNHTDDVNEHEPINLIGGIYNWRSVKQRLDILPNQPDAVFKTLPITS